LIFLHSSETPQQNNSIDSPGFDFGPNKETRTRMITLGINYSQLHDSSACIVRDGELLFAVAEERISRLKHDSRFPSNAIRACLDFTGSLLRLADTWV
jgi:hypothetical protein